MSDSRPQQRLLLAGFHPLIVEDSRLHAEGAYDIVAVSADETTLLPAVSRLKPDFVLLDLLHASSLRTIQRISALDPSCRVVVLTNMRRRDVVESIFSNGASGILHRSDAVAELFVAVRAVASGRQFMSSALRKAINRQTPMEESVQEAIHLSPLDGLVLRLVLQGYPVYRIARGLGLSVRTVRLSIAYLKRSFGVRTNQDLKHYAVANNLAADCR